MQTLSGSELTISTLTCGNPSHTAVKPKNVSMSVHPPAESVLNVYHILHHQSRVRYAQMLDESYLVEGTGNGGTADLHVGADVGLDPDRVLRHGRVQLKIAY